MGMVETIASVSTTISMANVRQDVSISLLKDIMDQSESNMMKIMSMGTVAQAPEGTTVDYII
ncbi:YjfB family protein [uncultured Tyzzerella sp.]|uniref:YjfB family protein n=1 Tax=uncultured Tyzzerella sp. TaxID=2321398 RepID=UPI002943754E|nr:YjfB family protein [uncultured Tyzzerella sp.]